MNKTRTTLQINRKLLAAMDRAGFTHEGLAAVESIDVTPQTVRRWTHHDQTPALAVQVVVAHVLNAERTHLWPASAEPKLPGYRIEPEVYPTRADVPAVLWVDPVRRATRNIAVRVFAGLPFFTTTPGLLDHLKSRADAGVPIRLLLGDPDSEAVARRASEEGTDLATRIRTVLRFLSPIMNYPGIEIRLDSTTLYYSLYAVDDVMIVNLPLDGVPAYEAPHLYLPRSHAEGMFDSYHENFELLWSRGRPVPTHSPTS